MNRRTVGLGVCLAILSVVTTATMAAVRIDGTKYKGKEYAVLRTEEPELEENCAVIVAYDRSKAVCLDEGKKTGERAREIGGRFCRKLALLPGEQTVEAKILEFGRSFREGAALPWSYSPTSEARSLTFTFEPGQTYQLHVTVHGELQVRCKRPKADFLKWGYCPD